MNRVQNIDAAKKDLLIMLIMIAISAVGLFLCNLANAKESLSSMGFLPLYVAVFFSAIVMVVSFFEAKSNDPFVTGKTQTMGVANSYTASPIFIIILSFYYNFVVVALVYGVIFLLSRFLGRSIAR